MSDEYTALEYSSRVTACRGSDECLRCDLRPEKYNDESVPEWQRKDNQQQRKLKHKRNGAKGLQQRNTPLHGEQDAR